MTNFSYCFIIYLLIISGIHSSYSRFLHPRSVEKLNYKSIPADVSDSEKLVSLNTHRGRQFFKESLKTHLDFPTRFSQDTFPPNDLVANCNDEIFARYIRWKGDMSLGGEKCKGKDELRGRVWMKRKKKAFKKAKKRYLDYTNSQMPFNEGTKASKFGQVENMAGKKEQSKNGNFENFKGLEEDLPEEYSRVRRFLDHQRVKKKVRTSITLEAKEAAMSRVLDPNLNLDGKLEPHVRKRRSEENALIIRRRPRNKFIYFVAND